MSLFFVPLDEIFWLLTLYGIDYFAWGETTPKTTYVWSNYKYCNGGKDQLIKYCSNEEYGYNGFTDNITELQPTDDAAAANWGSGWRIPTKEQWEEFFANTAMSQSMQNGIKGFVFTSSNTKIKTTNLLLLIRYNRFHKTVLFHNGHEFQKY